MGVDEKTVLLLRQWYEVSRSVDQLLSTALDGLGLTESAGAALWVLGPDQPAPTVRDLALTLGCDPSNASLVSAKLEQSGLLERRPHPTDGRARVLSLTAHGRELHARLIAEVAALTPLRRLDSGQQEQLSALLDVLSSQPH